MKALNVNKALGASSDGTPFQRGYKYGLLVARGEAQPATVSEPGKRSAWEQGYLLAETSERVRQAGKTAPKVVEHE